MPSLDLSALPPLRDIIRDHDLGAKKSLGQNFLLDLNLTRKIARTAKLTPDTNVIEIGPGPGGLTRAILEQDIKQLTAIERDDRCITALQNIVEMSGGGFTVMPADALEIDVVEISDAPRAVVANLPYNIATPLLIGWLRRSDAFQSMTLMFQKEVAMRIVAAPNTKAYGRLSVISQWRCRAEISFDVPRQAFTPPPKITSSIVHFVPRALSDDAPNFKSVERVTAMAFNQRRKMIRQSLKSLVPDIKSFLEEIGISETLRADALTVEDYLNLAKALEILEGTKA